MAGGLPQGILQVKASYLASPDSFTMYSSVPKNIESSVQPIFPLNPLSTRVGGISHFGVPVRIISVSLAECLFFPVSILYTFDHTLYEVLLTHRQGQHAV